MALEAEHGDDGKQQRDERDRADPGQKAGFIPFIPPSLDQPFAGEKSSQKGNAEIDQHRLGRSEEHTSELQSLMRISYAVFCLKKKTKLSDTKKDYHSTTEQSTHTQESKTPTINNPTHESQ